jgi:alpha-L-arabinofuranosidase
MHNKMKRFYRNALALTTTLAGLFLAANSAPAADGPDRITIKVDQPGIKVSPTLYGLMTEEINHSYDGGIYAELIQNRAFKDKDRAAKLTHWSLVHGVGAAGTMALDDANPVSDTALTTCLRLDITAVGGGQRVGVANDGYWGIPTYADTNYRASFYAKAGEGFTGPITVSLESNDGSTTYATASVPAITGTWQRYTTTLSTKQLTPSTTNRLVVWAGSKGTVYLNLVSLFPPTYNSRPNGNRIDIMQKLSDMKPTFLRLPGGNYLEGDTIDERFPWQKTLGDIAQRPGHRCCWNYPSSDGMGLLEFLEWCEDLHIEPVLAVYAGYSLRGDHVEPGAALQPFVDEAMDELEYVTGDASTKWGAIRVRDGHPEPFKLHYVEIGNEDWFDKSGSYSARFAQIATAIHAKYPDYKLIATAPIKGYTPDLIDDHFYRSAAEMARDSGHYDKYDRSAPKIFVGEWASTEGSPTPTMNAALGDAAWMTGMERNSDVVVISSYAPLFVNVNPGAHQWGTNLIGYDALNSFGSPSYYVQKMFNTNQGDTILPVEIVQAPRPLTEAAMPHGGVGVGSWMTDVEYKDIKVVNGDTVLYQADFAKGKKGWRTHGGDWKVEDGSLRQTGHAENCRATTGDAKWTDYTYTLKARKNGGDEGFLVLFHTRDPNNYIWWNIGGWRNTRTAMERSVYGAKAEIGESSSSTIETGRWYDIRVEVKGRDIKCFLNDKLVNEATDEPVPPLSGLYATASKVDSSGEVILKVVNTIEAPAAMQINLDGVTAVEPSATGQVISGQPLDVNSVTEPEKVVPHVVSINNAAKQFNHEFPPYSVTILRMKAK